MQAALEKQMRAQGQHAGLRLLRQVMARLVKGEVGMRIEVWRMALKDQLRAAELAMLTRELQEKAMSTRQGVALRVGPHREDSRDLQQRQDLQDLGQERRRGKHVGDGGGAGRCAQQDGAAGRVVALRCVQSVHHPTAAVSPSSRSPLFFPR